MPDIERYTPAQLADEVQRLADNFLGAVDEIATDNGYFEDIGEAIVSKDGGEMPDKSEMAGRIRAIPSPAHSPVDHGVVFYDFKGNLVKSYTTQETEALTELPEAPVIQGFTFQSWNWNLANIKTWIQNHDEGALSVGGCYVTSDGHTRIKMHLRESQMASIPMPFCIQQMAGTVVIDWGDDSPSETITTAGVYSHLWQVNSYPADVTIDIEYIPSGTTKLVLGRAVGSTRYGLFNNETYYASCVEKVEYGNNNDFTTYSTTFKNCYNLTQINIPDSVTSIGGCAFQNCTSLTHINIPDSVTSIGNLAFYNCHSLAQISIPDSVTSIGTNAFSNCYNLTQINIPDSVTSIGTDAFPNCSSLAQISIPDSVTSIGTNAFYSCTSLAQINISDSVMSIEGGAFQYCCSLTQINIPDGVTSIGKIAFSNCSSLYFINLTAFTDPQSVPALANVNAFSGIPASAQFKVYNQEMYDAFTTATNWSTFASKFVIEEA